jgi:radical SAM protein with 4Fe4S-binding SPASM domain
MSRGAFERFDADPGAYAEYLRTPLGRLRSEISWRNLLRRLPSPGATPPRALDLGAGTGEMALRLATAGWSVTLVDGSQRILERAEKLAAARGLGERISCRALDLELGGVAEAVGRAAFHLVVCHDVLEYLASPEALLREAGAALAPGGRMSLVVRNRAGEVMKRLIRANDPEEALAHSAARHMREELYGLDVRLFDPAEIRDLLAAAGLEVVAECGVRVAADRVTDWIRGGDDAFARTVELELRLGENPELRPLSRYLQVIAGRRGDGGVRMDDDASARRDASPRQVASPRFALGLGLTNECNLSCAFCYRDPARKDRLEPEQVAAVLRRLPVHSVNLGTGESGLHPRFLDLVGLIGERNVKLTMTSNGHSVAVLPDEVLRSFHDVELSLDFPTKEEQDAQRGPGNWDLVHEQAARCRQLGVPVTFVAVMMRTNYLRLVDLAHLAAAHGAPLRVNVYQSVRSDAYALAYEQYWEGFERLFEATDALAVGEPLVRAMAGLPRGEGGCGVGTVRVTPRGTVQPCVYWPGPGDPLARLLDEGAAVVETRPFQEARTLPKECEPCAFRDACRGGCAGRRRLDGALDRPDRYCPVVRGERRSLAVRCAPGRDLPKVGSACTTIVMARPRSH